MGHKLNEVVMESVRTGVSLEELLVAAEKRYLVVLLHDCNGNQVHVARRTGWHRNTLARRLDQLQIDARKFRQPRRKKARMPNVSQYRGA